VRVAKKSLCDMCGVFVGALRTLPEDAQKARFSRNNGSISLERTERRTYDRAMKKKNPADVNGRSLYDNFRHYLVSADVHSSHCLPR